jgi:hypothetical protein
MDYPESEVSQENILETKNLVLISVNELLESDFFIPSYQRGYRWTDVQVKQLLNDIWDFKTNPPKTTSDEEKPFYCLQPIAVKKKIIDGKHYWEVIDGQQRLTTILIVLYYFNQTEFKRPKRLFTIEYQTRANSEEFLRNITDKELASTNIDYHHIYLAYQTIDKWFSKLEKLNDAIRGDFHSVLINAVKIIWYKVELNDQANTNSASIDVFTRLNIGKIPLTNAELIKALFLQKGNFEEDKVDLKQLQIASEWDTIEKQLQDNAFWFFIYDPDNPLKYENRIEYIFDLMKGKDSEKEHYYTFNTFNADFEISKGDKSRPDIDALWLDVKRYFLSFEEWFKNKEFYHLVGFLVDCSVPINSLKEKAEKSSKTAFREFLKKAIKKQVACNVDTLVYGDFHTRRVLLLFNIQTILGTENADFRFPFYRYKDEDWDIEHVRSQTTKKIPKGQRHTWALDILEYLTGVKGYNTKKNDSEEESEKEQQAAAVSKMEDEDSEKKIASDLIKMLNSDSIDDQFFEKVYKDISELFHENENPDEINSISNLALLDATTNRSYKNAMFPIKRKKIIDNDMNGIFVPICTRNLFLKSYSRKMSDLLYWKANDASDYLAGIKRTIKEFLPPQK